MKLPSADQHSRRTVDTPRICLLSETFHPIVGGGENHAKLLAENLNRSGIRTFVITRRSHLGLSPCEIVGNTTAIRTPPAGAKRWGKYLMIPFVLRELDRRRNEYDLILVCGFRVLGCPALAAARHFGKRCVLRAEVQGEMSGSYVTAHRPLPAPIRYLLPGWAARRSNMLRQADAFVSISGVITRELIAAGVDGSLIHSIPNGIDTSRFPPVDPLAKAEMRDRLGLPRHAIIASYSGKLNRGKGLECLVKAWRKVKDQCPTASLVLVGSGGGQSLSCEDYLRLLVKTLDMEDAVVFTGYVQNVQEYLQASDLFVFPSEFEAFGLSLIEAMCSGLPIVATRTGGIPEIVDTPDLGILVEPANHDQLAEAILTTIRNPAEARAMAERGRCSVLERYAIGEVSARYADLFRSLHTQ